MPDLSVVLPMYNEEGMIDRVLSAVSEQLEASGLGFEFVCVDDGSTDRTGTLLDEVAAHDPRVVPVHFSRNFGKEAALYAGLATASGDAVLFMDADLQHPPQLIPKMLDKWREGFEVVDAVKANRGREGLWYKLAARVFYAIVGTPGGRKLRDSSDFKLLDRQVVDAVLACPERHRFFRGLVAWVGFRVARVPFEVQSRAAGETSWGLRGLVAYSLRNIVAFSSAPLRLVAWLGFITVALDALLAVQTFWNWWRGVAVDGFTTVILTVGLLCGLILLSLGVVAIYVAQLYDEQKGRPLYIVRKSSPHTP